MEKKRIFGNKKRQNKDNDDATTARCKVPRIQSPDVIISLGLPVHSILQFNCLAES